MENILYLDTYVKRMEKSCLDKLFFLDKIYDPIHTILDFGCANGALIQAMRMFSRAVRKGSKLAFWNTKPMLLRRKSRTFTR